MKAIFKTIGDYTRKKRLAKGITQAQLAGKLGYTSSQFVSNVERGMCCYPAGKMARLAQTIDADLGHMANVMIAAYSQELREKLKLAKPAAKKLVKEKPAKSRTKQTATNTPKVTAADLGPDSLFGA